MEKPKTNEKNTLGKGVHFSSVEKKSSVPLEAGRTKKIAVITMGVALEGEKGYTRFKYLSEFLVQHGFEVDLITTSFQHWEKKQRDIALCKSVRYPFKLHFIYEPGYQKNIDLKRVYSHHIAAKNMKKWLLKNPGYDLIYSEIPPNDVAKQIAIYCERNHIPYVVDINDLWPEAMKMALDIPLLNDFLFYPFKRDAEFVYARVSSVVGTSDEYRDRAFQNNRRKNVPSRTVYVGNELRVFDQGVKKYADDILKGADEYWVTYAGTLGKSYDIKTLIAAGKALLSEEGERPIRIVILGGGPDEAKLKAYNEEIGANALFAGYQPYEKMAAYLSKSDVLVNSFVKKAPQSIVTKIGDYLAAGKPMINTLNSAEFRKKVENDGFGLNIEAENVEELKNAVLTLYQNARLSQEMGRKARHIAETQFDRPIAYEAIAELINHALSASRG